MPAYRMKCQNPKCAHEFHRFFPVEEYDRQHFGSGWACFHCGYPRMMCMNSKRVVKDSFVPGWQKNIQKHCWTYSEYKKHLKLMGIVEIGYEDITKYHKDETLSDFAKGIWSDDIIKIAIQKGSKLSSGQWDAIKSGKAFE